MPTLAALKDPRNLAALAPFMAQLGGYYPPRTTLGTLNGASGNPVSNPPNMPAPPIPTPPEANAPRSPGGGQGRPAGQLAPSRLGDLAARGDQQPVNLGVDPIPAATGPSLGDLNRQALDGVKLHHGPNWGKIGGIALGVLGDALATYGGGQPIYGPMIARRNQLKAESDYDLQKFNEELRLKREEALNPHLEQVGNTIGMVDGRANGGAGSYSPIYTAPGAPEQYASLLGFQAGTPEYANAAREYVLRGNSDYATGNKLDLIDHRFDRSDAQLGQRLATTRRGQDLTHGDRQATIRQSDINNRRTTATSTANNVRSTDTSAANNTATNRMRFQTSRHGKGAPVRVNSPDEARRLPPGTFIEVPDGRILQVPGR